MIKKELDASRACCCDLTFIVAFGVNVATGMCRESHSGWRSSEREQRRWAFVVTKPHGGPDCGKLLTSVKIDASASYKAAQLSP